MAKENVEQVNFQKINRLGAAIRTGSGRGNVLYLGWSEGGTPVISRDGGNLSDSAKESLGITKAVKGPNVPLDSSQSIEPVQYLTSLPSIDKPDTEDEYTEDVLVLGVANNQGITNYVNVSELELMDGILRGHVVWQDVNSRTVLGNDEVTPTLPMHSVFLPVQKNDGQCVTYAMLFEPTMANESNEPAFKLFVAQVMKSFLALDGRQIEGAKKGYEKVIRDFQSSEGVGGDAFVVMKALKDMGLADNITDQKLDKIWRESAGKGFTYQLMLLGREFGLLNFESAEPHIIKTQLDKMSLDQLMDLLSVCYKVVSRTFSKGK